MFARISCYALLSRNKRKTFSKLQKKNLQLINKSSFKFPFLVIIWFFYIQKF